MSFFTKLPFDDDIEMTITVEFIELGVFLIVKKNSFNIFQMVINLFVFDCLT